MSMEIYFIRTTARPLFGALGTSEYCRIYIPSPYSVVIEKANNEKFDYKNDRESIDNAERIINGEAEGKASKIEMDVDEVTALLGFGVAKEKADKDFNKQAKSLFEIVNEKASKGCCS